MANRSMENDYDMAFESTIAAYFINPVGKVVSTNGRSHISMIIAEPEKFGFTKEYIQDAYDKYKEKLGVEGTAREDLIKELINKGWTRVRRYPNKFWSIQVKNLDKKSKDYLHDFASKILKGIDGFKELDIYMPVKIDSEKNVLNSTIEKIASNDLYSSKQAKEKREEVTFVKRF